MTQAYRTGRAAKALGIRGPTDYSVENMEQDPNSHLLQSQTPQHSAGSPSKMKKALEADPDFQEEM